MSKLQMHEHLHKNVNENIFIHIFKWVFMIAQLKQQICYSFTMLFLFVHLKLHSL